MGVARRGRPHARTRLVAVVCAALAVAACGAGGASLPPAPSGVPSLRDTAPEEAEGLPVDPGTKPIGKGSYSWELTRGSGGAWGLANGVETIWDPDLGIIILGPEEDARPTATTPTSATPSKDEGRGEVESVSQMILNVGDPEPDGRLPITAATLSWTAKRFGSLDRGEAELFEATQNADAGFVRIEERGPNYLKGTFVVNLQRAAALVGGLELDDREIRLVLQGRFVAVEP